MSENKEMKVSEMEKLPILGARPRDEKEEKYLREFAEYEFYNLEDTGLSETFPYGSTNRHMNFTFFHGGKYHIPRHVARHIDTRSTPRWEWRPDGTGRMIKQRVGEKPRFQMRQVYS